MIRVHKKGWFELGFKIGLWLILLAGITVAYIYSWILIYP